MNRFGLKSDSSKCGHVAQRGPRLKLKQKRETMVENQNFCCFVRMRVREERKRRAKSFLPRSTKFRRSKFVGPRTKVHRIDEGYAWVSKMRDFAKDLNKEFKKSKVSGLGSVHEASKGLFYAPRGRESFLLGFIFHFWAGNG